MSGSMLDDEDFITKKKIQHKPTLQGYWKELKDMRKADKNVELYEQAYYELTGRNLYDMNIEQMNDLMLFVINQKINYEIKQKEEN